MKSVSEVPQTCNLSSWRRFLIWLLRCEIATPQVHTVDLTIATDAKAGAA